MSFESGLKGCGFSEGVLLKFAFLSWCDGGKQHYKFVKRIVKRWFGGTVDRKGNYEKNKGVKFEVNLFSEPKDEQAYNYCVVCLRVAGFNDKQIEKWMGEQR